MILTFLSGSGRLARLNKTFTAEPDGGITKTAYPNANKMTSFTEDVDTPEDFLAAIRSHAMKGHALFTGHLTRPIRSESRKGLAVRNNHMPWICLDLDKADIPDVDAFLQGIQGFTDVSYIVAHSASSGFSKGTNAHIFFLLDAPAPHSVLMTLINALNWHVPLLRAQLKLSDTQRSLSKVLDTAGVRPAGLIYLAPPELVGLIDPFNGIDERIYLVKKERQAVTLSRFPALWMDEALVGVSLRQHLNELRDVVCLPPMDVTQRRVEIDGAMIDYDTVPGNLRISLVAGPISTNGMVRCNVNDGDSAAYYFNYGPIGDGLNGTVLTLLHNFKGDAPIALATAAPDFARAWNASFAKVATAAAPEWLRDFQQSVGASGVLLSPITDAEDPYKDMDKPAEDPAADKGEDTVIQHMDPRGTIIFRDGYTGEYYEYAYLAATGTPFFSRWNKPDAILRAKAIGLRYDKERGFPTLWMTHDPRKQTLLYEVDGVPMINAFVHPKTIRYDAVRDIEIDKAIDVLMQRAPTIGKCFMHTFAYEKNAVNQFLNWLSVHFTIPDAKVNTAWLLRGVQGSGKSLITSDIMPTILGHGHSENNVDAVLGYCTTVKLATVMDKFSGWQIGKRLVEVEEAEFTGTERANRKQGMQEFKRLITRERADINVKYGGQMTNVRTTAAFIFTTNRPDDFPIEDNDRRFHVPQFQHTPLWDVLPMVREDFYALRAMFHTEARAAGDVLSRIKANIRTAQTPYDGGDKGDIISANRSGMENYVHMIAAGSFDDLAEVVLNEISEGLTYAGKYESAAHLTAAKTIAYIAMTDGQDTETPAELILAMAKALGYASERSNMRTMQPLMKANEVLHKRARMSKGYVDMFPEKATANPVSVYIVDWKSRDYTAWCAHPIVAGIISEQRGKTNVMAMIHA